MSDGAIVGVDPGTTQSAVVCLDPDGKVVCSFLEPNVDVLRWLRAIGPRDRVLAMEMVASYGMTVGREVFETVLWAGRFVEAWGGRHQLIYRRQVKLHLCRNSRATDSNVRQALLDRYGPGKALAVGVKARPGPLYGFRKDLWAALAVGVTAIDADEELNLEPVHDER